MPESQNEPEHVEVRYKIPKDVHDKIKSHKRKISADADTDATMEEAVIDFIRKAKLKRA